MGAIYDRVRKVATLPAKPVVTSLPANNANNSTTIKLGRPAKSTDPRVVAARNRMAAKRAAAKEPK